jgi:acyl carrier protein
MTRDDIIAKLSKVMNDMFGEDNAGQKLDLSFNQLGIDSLSIVELGMECEDAFEMDGMAIPDDVIDGWKKPRDIVDYLVKYFADGDAADFQHA